MNLTKLIYLFQVIPLIFTMVLLKLFDIDEFVGGDRWIYILLILFFYGFAHIPQMYLLSYLFKASATGFAACVGINILLSIFLFCLNFTLIYLFIYLTNYFKILSKRPSHNRVGQYSKFTRLEYGRVKF